VGGDVLGAGGVRDGAAKGEAVVGCFQVSGFGFPVSLYICDRVADVGGDQKREDMSELLIAPNGPSWVRRDEVPKSDIGGLSRWTENREYTVKEFSPPAQIRDNTKDNYVANLGEHTIVRAAGQPPLYAIGFSSIAGGPSRVWLTTSEADRDAAYTAVLSAIGDPIVVPSS